MHIKTISEIIAKQLTGTGQMWTQYLQICMYVHTSLIDTLKFTLEWKLIPKKVQLAHSKNTVSYIENILHISRR